MQVGEQGLYYMGSNPLNLPVPELCGKASMYVRLGSSGKTKIENEEARYMILRAEAKLLISEQSPYTLEDENNAKELISWN